MTLTLTERQVDIGAWRSDIRTYLDLPSDLIFHVSGKLKAAWHIARRDSTHSLCGRDVAGDAFYTYTNIPASYRGRICKRCQAKAAVEVA